jgi:hypothetical protein
LPEHFLGLICCRWLAIYQGLEKELRIKSQATEVCAQIIFRTSIILVDKYNISRSIETCQNWIAGRIFSGSIGATVTPPYDYQWTWSAVSGNPDENSETADHNSGDMSINIWADFNNSSAVSGRAAVGIYFYPPADNGTLQIWSSPSFNYDWGDWCAFDSASADGWIGFYVGSYDLTGAPTGAVVDQQVTLWSDSSWWSGVGEQSGSNSGWGLNPSPIQVDQDHQYIIWIWCGGDVSAAGWGTFSGSGAGDDLNLAVPSITWELG